MTLKASVWQYMEQLWHVVSCPFFVSIMKMLVLNQALGDTMVIYY